MKCCEATGEMTHARWERQLTRHMTEAWFLQRMAALALVCWLWTSLLLFCGAQAVRPEQTDVQVLSLNGKWSLRNGNGSLSLSAAVPGCVHTALQAAEFIQDPYYRFNDVLYRWISLDNWTYSLSFSAPPWIRTTKRVVLLFEEVDTISTITFNGVVIETTDNMFRSYEFELSGLLKKDVNLLEVAFVSAITYASQASQAHSSYKVPPDCPPPVQNGECHVNFIRKSQSSFSWDWGPAFPTQGLKGVQLQAFNFIRLQSLTTSTSRDSSSWIVDVDLFFDVVMETAGRALLFLPDLNVFQDFQLLLKEGQSKTSLVLLIPANVSVDLWWPNGHGHQVQYRLFLEARLDTGATFHREARVAFRTVELVQETIPSSPGLSFYFKVNGRPIFLKGSNWIPAHSFQDLVTPDMLRNLLQSAVDANMNILRVWGGGVYEQEAFYHLCDELGLMVWQDFMFACALYSIEKDFIQTVRYEVTQQVQRLKSHPSIIVWSGNNENEAAIATNWFSIPDDKRTRYVKDYVTLYVDNVKAIVEQDRTRPFLVSSPTNGLESEKEGFVAHDPYDVHYGDTHFYSYVKDCLDWNQFPRTRLASEYGFQSWPSFSSLSKVSLPEDWEYNSKFSDHRQHHELGNLEMLLQVALNYRFPNNTDTLQRYKDTLYMTQVMQAECVKKQTEFYRRSRSEIIDGKGHTMGALYWQLNDIWQGASWSSIEFGGKWKMLHYLAVEFFSPVLPVGFEENGTLKIYGISDLSTNLTLRVKVTVYQWSSLTPACSSLSEERVLIENAATLMMQCLISDLLRDCGKCSRSSCLITFDLHDSSNPTQRHGPTNHLFLTSLRDAELHKPNITAFIQHDGNDFLVTLKCDAVGVFVWLDVGDIAGRFDSNGFLLLTLKRTVHFFPWTTTSVEELSENLHITSLHDVY
ncbi:beta-mannosidase isoform X2 [Denticeps clupeoides]|uniref:beta-mannosidase isoform X2 n=1 Tax=Denticeps clupeoides TaxID=299321 RepID=UPI0010A2FAFD|nr:beta-mannosidase isoform X2 [Denticeps clupeoides]